MVYRDSQGRIRFKIVFWGPSLSGKTTMLKALYNRLRVKIKGRIKSIEDPSGRTLFFDYVPFGLRGNVVFDVYTVPGQRRHKRQRKIILQGADAIIFVVDSSPDALAENIYSFRELKEFLGQEFDEIPIVVALNKRDLDDALPERVLVKALRLDGPWPIHKTIATEGLGVKRVFQDAAQLSILYRAFPNEYERFRRSLALETREKFR